MTVEHPCLSCPLNDCDDQSRQCNLRQYLNAYDRARRAGKPVSDHLRQSANIAWHEFYGIARTERKRALRQSEVRA